MTRARELAELGSVYNNSALSNRNLIINGGMKISQRATSKTGAQATGYHTLDRWQTYSAATDQLAVTMSQDTSVPSGQGFSNSMKFLTATAETAIRPPHSSPCGHKTSGCGQSNSYKGNFA